jgi:hypothetical protein
MGGQIMVSMLIISIYYKHLHATIELTNALLASSDSGFHIRSF